MTAKYGEQFMGKNKPMTEKELVERLKFHEAYIDELASIGHKEWTTFGEGLERSCCWAL
jgi:hypothetical protein